ncbi:MAG: sugar transporter, partial [Bacteroidia bacterium]|nr:sugar transporter [Bacteroidia bacterium]
IQLCTKLIANIKLIAQAFAVKFLPDGYIWWLVLEVVFATITAIILSRTVNKTFPYIKEEVQSPAQLRHKYPDVATKVKQLFVHKIGGFVVNQTIPLIIYAYATLTLVAKYGNYLIFTNNLNYILSACFLGLAASVGNLVAEGNRTLTIKVFRELFSIRYFMTFVCCICLWFLVDPFISIWIGQEYILDRSTVLLIIIVFYIQNTRNVVDTFINAFGLFRDIWAPLVESVICLGLSILLGHFYSINGILAGLIISQLIIVKTWKPVFLFKCGMKEPLRVYCGITLKHLVIGALTSGIMYFITSKVTFDPSASFGAFCIYACPFFIVTCVIMFALLYACEKGMRGFVSRMFKITVRTED